MAQSPIADLQTQWPFPLKRVSLAFGLGMALFMLLFLPLSGVKARTISDIRLTKQAPATAYAGESIAYSLEIENTGDYDMSNVELTDTLPASVTLSSITGLYGGLSCLTAGSTIYCSVASLGGNSTAGLTINGTIRSDIRPGTSLENEASVSADSTELIAEDDFDPINNDLWFFNTGTENTSCGSVSGDALYFNPSPGSVPRIADTEELDLIGADSVAFSLIFGSGSSPCEDADGGEDVVLEYSTDGGGSWTTIATYDTEAYTSWTSVVATIPTAGRTSATRLRWRQLSFTDVGFDNWAIDNVQIIDDWGHTDTAAADTAILSKADLEIAKSGPATVIAGNQITYTLDLLNNGPSTAWSMMVEDILPDGVSLVSISGADCGSTVCDLGDLAAGATANLTVVGAVDPAVASGTTLSNRARVFSDSYDPTSANDEATYDTQVTTEADLSVLKRDLFDPVGPNEGLIYEIVVTNDGPSDAIDVTTQDTLDSNVTFAGGSSECSESSGVVTCSTPELAAGDSIRYLVAVTVNDIAGGTTLTNQVAVSSSVTDPDAGNNTATEDTSVQVGGGQNADLSLTKSGAPATVYAGETVVYTLTVANNGPLTAHNVQLTDFIPEGAQLTAAAAANPADPDAACSLGGVCHLGVISSSGSAQALLTMTVDSDYTGSSLLNQAYTLADEADPDTANNFASATTNVAVEADLELAKVDLIDPVGPTEPLLYQIVVTNTGPSAAQDVVITDSLDSNVTFIEATPGCSHAAGLVTCQAGTLAPGEKAGYLISVQVSDIASGTILSNVAGVETTTTDPDTTNNNSGPITTTVQQQSGPNADLSLIKTVTPTATYIGRPLTYTLVVTNGGPGAATNVQLVELLPDGLLLEGLQLDNPDFDGEFCLEDASYCYLGLVDTTTRATLTLQTRVDPGFSGSSLVNNAYVIGDQTDPDFGNNSDTVTVTIDSNLGCAARVNDESTIYLLPQLAVDAAQAGDTVKVAGYCIDHVTVTKTLTIRGGYTFTNWTDSDPTANPATIDANGTGRVIDISGGVTVDIENIELTGGNPGGTGGGVQVDSLATVTVQGSRIYNNTATQGGGLYSAGDLTLIETEVGTNTVSGEGGGVYVAGTATLTDSDILNNTASGTAGGAGLYAVGAINLNGGLFADNSSPAGDGGGLLTESNLQLTDTILRDNYTINTGGGAYVGGSATLTGGLFETNEARSDLGGGLYVAQTLSLSGTQFIDNIANNGGGGAFAEQDTTAINGYFANNESQNGDGGGLAVEIGGNLVLSSSTFLTNTAHSDGGAVSVRTGSATITDSYFEANQAVDRAGAILILGTATLSNTEIIDNDCTDIACDGGGLYTGGALTLIANTISDNSAGDDGGGVYAFDSVTATDNLFSGNQCVSLNCSGGGLYANDALSLSRDRFLDNGANGSGGDGGAIYHDNGQGELVNSIFAGNTASDDGAGLYLDSDDQVEINHVTLSENSGSGIYVAAGTVEIRNTILATHTTAIERAGGAASEDYNLFYNNGTDLSGLSAGSNSLTGDPFFADAAADDYHLTEGSAAIDLGETTAITTDFDQNSRPGPDTNAVDMGAYEFFPVYVDLVMSKDGPATVAVGDTITYTLVAKSNSPANVRQVVITDTLPEDVTLLDVITHTTGSCITSTEQVVCTVPVLRASRQVPQNIVTFTIVVQTDRNLDPGTTLVNTAYVEGPVSETDMDNNEDTVHTTLIAGITDLVLSKTGPLTVTAGEQITYTVIVTNNGPAVAQSARVVDTLPPAVDLDSVTISRSGSDPAACDSATCQVGNLDIEEILTITLVGTVEPDTPEGDTLTNRAAVFSDTPISNTATTSDSWSTIVGAGADLHITKVALQEPVGPTENLMYEITVRNYGPSAAEGVSITDTLDSNVTFSTASFGCAESGGAVSCQLDRLEAGDLERYLLVVAVQDVASGTLIVNQAVVTATTADPDDSNNTTTVTTTVEQKVGPGADLSIDKQVAGPATPIAGEWITYTLTVTNAGPVAALNVVVLDRPPAGTTLVEAPADADLFCTAQGVCSLGQLAAGANRSFTLGLHIHPDYPVPMPDNIASLVNIATVSSDQYDPNTADNLTTITATVSSQAAMEIAKAALSDPVIAGEPLMYQIRITNTGPSLARQVVIQDYLPLSTTFIGASDFCAESGGVVSCPVGQLEVAETESAFVQVRVADDVVTGTTLTNQAFVGAANAPSVPMITVDSQVDNFITVDYTDLSLNKVGQTGGCEAPVTFTITIANNGPLAVPLVDIKDTLPDGLNLEQASIIRSNGSLRACAEGICQLGDMIVDEVATMTLIASFASDITPGTVLVNRATVFGSVSDSRPGNNSDSHSVLYSTDCKSIWPSYLPLILKPASETPMPDLVGEFSLSPDKTDFAAGEAVQINVTVTNIGDGDAGPFWVDFYINPTDTPSPNYRWYDLRSPEHEYGLAWYVSGLAAGESINLNSASGYDTGQTIWDGSFAAGASDLYLLVDSWNATTPGGGISTGAVEEISELNNLSEQHSLTVSGLGLNYSQPPPDVPLDRSRK